MYVRHLYVFFSGVSDPSSMNPGFISAAIYPRCFSNVCTDTFWFFRLFRLFSNGCTDFIFRVLKRVHQDL